MVAILWSDVEAEFVQDMTTALTARTEPYAGGVAVRTRVPEETPGDPWPASGRLVVVRDDGGPTTQDVRATARLGVRVFGVTEQETNQLANLVVALVRGWRSPVVRRAGPSRPFTVTEESRRPAAYFTAELLIRGRALPTA